jgi:serine/threonine protein phosphatase PrpC
MIHFSRSIRGRNCEVNSDHVGTSYKEGAGIFVIADGTSRPGSKQLSEAFVQHIIARYEKGNGDIELALPADTSCHYLETMLNDTHAQLFADPWQGSTSYLVVLIENDALTLAYEGDCCAGLVHGRERIEWLNPPHCMANWRRDRAHSEIALDRGRHRLTRSFRAGRKPEPDIMSLQIKPDARIILATDGFWAQLSDVYQATWLAFPESETPEADDDLTWIDLKLRS